MNKDEAGLEAAAKQIIACQREMFPGGGWFTLLQATELARAAIAAHQAKGGGPVRGEPDGIGIKPLEWRELTSPREDGPPEPIGEWEADSAVGIYIIKDEGGEWWLGLATVHDTVQIGRSSDPDILRSKAQADYEAGIRSALTSPASGERDAATASDESDVGVIQSLRDNLTEAVVALMAAELVLSHTGHEGSLVLMQVRAVIAKSDGAK